MRRRSLVLLSTVALAACATEPAPQADPDRTVIGGGVLVPGWRARTDSGVPPDNVRFVESAGAFEISVGPGLILYRPDHVATGRYKLTATVIQLNSKGHAHGAGLIFGGRDLTGTDQVYTYFLVRGDGSFIVKTRVGTETHLLSERWVAHQAIHREGWNGQAENRLEVEIGAEVTVFRVNGTDVFRHETRHLFHDGVYGLRLNHNLDMRIDGPHLLEAR